MMRKLLSLLGALAFPIYAWGTWLQIQTMIFLGTCLSPLMVFLFLSRSSQTHHASEAQLQTQKVMIIDDDQISASLMEKLLLRLDPDLDVVAINDAAEGILKMKREQPALIILDMMMPNIRGDYVVRKISKDQPELIKNMMVITALNENSQLMRDVIRLRIPWVPKPIQKDQFHKNVLSILSQSQSS
jgi:CheY-like chemotaxis protein